MPRGEIVPAGVGVEQLCVERLEAREGLLDGVAGFLIEVRPGHLGTERLLLAFERFNLRRQLFELLLLAIGELLWRGRVRPASALRATGVRRSFGEGGKGSASGIGPLTQ